MWNAIVGNDVLKDLSQYVVQKTGRPPEFQVGGVPVAFSPHHLSAQARIPFEQWMQQAGAPTSFDSRAQANELRKKYEMSFGEGEDWRNLPQQFQQLHAKAFSPEWGRAGISLDQVHSLPKVGLQNIPITINGKTYARTGQELTPRISNLAGSNPLYEQALKGWGGKLGEYYDNEYGWVLPMEVAQSLDKLMESQNKEGLLAEDGPLAAASKTVGAAFGVSNLAAMALQSLAANGSTWAASALANAGGAGVPWQSLGSSLSANAASQGGSWSDFMNMLQGKGSVPLGDVSKVAGWSETLAPNISDSFAATDALKATNGFAGDALQQLAGSGDAIEALAKSLELTGAETATEAAKALGFNGTYEMLQAANPSWLSTAGSAAATLQKLGLTSAASALTSGMGSSVADTVGNALGNIGLKDLIAAGATIGGSLLNSGAAKDAAQSQVEAAREAAALQKYMFDTTRSDLMPWMEQGKVALGRVGEMLGISGDPKSQGYGSLMRNFGTPDLEADPIYGAARDFQLGETRNILTNAASARGETDSGVMMKDLLKYGTGVLSGTAGDAFNRFNANRTMQYNFLAPTANLGQTTGIQLGQVGQQAGQIMGQNITGAGNAQAAGAVGSANAMNSGISQILKQFYDNDLLRRFAPQISGGGMSPYGGSYGVFAE